MDNLTWNIFIKFFYSFISIDVIYASSLVVGAIKVTLTQQNQFIIRKTKQKMIALWLKAMWWLVYLRK